MGKEGARREGKGVIGWGREDMETEEKQIRSLGPINVKFRAE